MTFLDYSQHGLMSFQLLVTHEINYFLCGCKIKLSYHACLILRKLLNILEAIITLNKSYEAYKKA